MVYTCLRLFHFQNESPTRVITGSSSRTSLVSSEDEKSDEVDKDEKPDGLLRAEEKTEDAPKFKSPLLQKLTDKSQNVDSGTPKFKSPLLQSIMGKTKIGARLSGTRLEEMDKSTENLTESKSSERLSEKESSEKEDSDKDKDTLEPQTNGVDSSQNIDSVEEDTDFVAKMDFDAHENVPVSVTSLEGKYRIQSDSMVGSAPNTDGITDSQMLIGSTADSAVCLSFTNGITTSQNGDIHIEQRGITDSKEFIDSR
ncbi:hypothetical protein DPMN_051046 [Dreissena polymorpha]|uniref:Uncharacterized protein n=1 Tax=Dreissena polymorpha TaxID=45954 RepID=A0A9D4CJ93_DREPO|nr:hypothetical protein DPMN_051046 [Dreissena polymorpha]